MIKKQQNKKRLKKWLLISSKVIHKTSWIKVKADKCKVGKKVITYTYTKRIDEGPVIIPEAEKNTLYLVKQYRHPIKKIIWQFPAEGKYKHETWKKAAKRGIEEEVGLIPQKLINIGTFYPDPGGLEQKTKFFIAKDLKPLNKKTKNRLIKAETEEEKLKIKKFTKKEINKLIKKGKICDNWTLAALFLYDNYYKNK